MGGYFVNKKLIRKSKFHQEKLTIFFEVCIIFNFSDFFLSFFRSVLISVTYFHAFTRYVLVAGDEKDEDDEKEKDEGFEYPVVKKESFILSDASATPLYWH